MLDTCLVDSEITPSDWTFTRGKCMCLHACVNVHSWNLVSDICRDCPAIKCYYLTWAGNRAIHKGQHYQSTGSSCLWPSCSQLLPLDRGFKCLQNNPKMQLLGMLSMAFEEEVKVLDFIHGCY